MSNVKRLDELLYDLTDTEIYLTRTCIPAKVLNYDTSEQKVDVLVLIQEKFWNDGYTVSGSLELKDVPVAFPAAADDVYMALPLKTGSLGVLHVADRALEKYLDSDGTVAQDIGDDFGHHEIEDSFFVPGLRPYKRALTGISDSEMILRNENSKIRLQSNKIALQNNTAELVADLNLTIAELSTLCTNLITLVNATAAITVGGTPVDSPQQAAISAVAALITTNKSVIDAQKTKLDTLEI